MLRPDNWLDAAYKSSLRQEYNVSVSAGSDKSSFYASFNYLDNEGITANSDFERLTGRLRADYQVKPWLKVGANMSYAHFESNSLSEDGSSGSSGNILPLQLKLLLSIRFLCVMELAILCKTLMALRVMIMVTA